jgi:hypothetical protein
LLARALVVALNVPVFAPPATVTDAGTVSAGWLLVRLTAAPPAGAALVKVTVHVLDAFAPRLVGLQVSEETRTDATSPTVAFAELAP